MKELIEAAVEAAKELKERETAKEGVLLGAQEIRDVELAQAAQWEAQVQPLIYEPDVKEERRGGLAACNYKCITSYCYPPNLAKGIGSSKPHAPNSSVGHS